MSLATSAVYYSINDSDRYIYLALESVASVRKFDPTIPVYVHFYGSPAVDVRAGFEALGATLVAHDAIFVDHPTFLKWLPLQDEVHREHSQLLFLDADTVAYSGLRGLLAKLSERDFYARREIGTEVADVPTEIGSLRFAPGLKSFMGKIRAGLGSADVPVFNTGVMVFNRGMHRLVADMLEEIIELKALFTAGQLPYPSYNQHIMEEIVISLVMGRMHGVTFGLIEQADSPWFLELREKLVPGPGVVLHVWSSYYAEYLEFMRDDAASEKYRARFEARVAGLEA